jgi:hypothetical protein
MAITLEGLRTVLDPAPDLHAAKACWTALLGQPPYFDEPGGATVHTPASEGGEGIVTGSVRTPSGAILGLIDNPHFTPADAVTCTFRLQLDA